MGMLDFLKGKKNDDFMNMDIDAPNMYPHPALNQSPDDLNNNQLSQMGQPMGYGPMPPPQQMNQFNQGPPPMQQRFPPQQMNQFNQGPPPMQQPPPDFGQQDFGPPQFNDMDMAPSQMMPPSAPLPPPPPPPSPNQGGFDDMEAPESNSGNMELVTEDIEKIAEGIIDEKWDKISASLDELKTWKKNIENQVNSLKDTVNKMDTKLSDTQKAIVSKVNDYNSSLSDVNVELKAMSKVFDKVLPTFTDNVKKLSVITTKISKSKSK